MYIQYQKKRFKAETRAVIDAANAFIQAYQDAGYDLTLRQLYYVFVSKDLLANDQREYKRLGTIISDARMAGLTSWEAIVDRTRRPKTPAYWDDPADLVSVGSQQFAVDFSTDQSVYVEVWVEKEALAGVVERSCARVRCPSFSCRGYASQSSLWSAARRIYDCAYNTDDYVPAKRAVILHLGDHDPSGIDMTRDIRERMSAFLSHWVREYGPAEGIELEVQRIALNMDQIEQYNPPPNPAKLSDSRASKYVERFGYRSWELDALEPKTLDALIVDRIRDLRDAEVQRRHEVETERGREELRRLAQLYARRSPELMELIEGEDV